MNIMKKDEFHKIYMEFNKENKIKIPTGPTNSLSDYDLAKYHAKKYISLFESFMEEEDLAQELYIDISNNLKKGLVRTNGIEQKLLNIYNRYVSQKYYEEIEEDYYYIDNQIYKNMLSNSINEIMETLLPRERRIIELRYGLNGDIEKSLTETGKYLDVSKERIRQIEMKAMRKLRHPYRYKYLIPYKEALEVGNGEL